MTDKEIRKRSAKLLLENTDTFMTSLLYFFATAAIILMAEGGVSILIKMFSDGRYSLGRFFVYYRVPLNLLLLLLRVIVYFILISLAHSVLMQYFIRITADVDLGKFIRMHFSRLIYPGVKGSVCLLLYKLMVSAPLGIGIYGILHFRTKSYSVNLSLFDLVGFMLCIGFSIVWLGALVHYFMSLSLVKYIFAINPRANFFNACDLSVKLMEGKHMRVLHFWIEMIPYMAPGLLMYPLIIIYPFVSESRILLAKEIMGSYWQDKLPAMARRWERQQKRLKRP